MHKAVCVILLLVVLGPQQATAELGIKLNKKIRMKPVVDVSDVQFNYVTEATMLDSSHVSSTDGTAKTKFATQDASVCNAASQEQEFGPFTATTTSQLVVAAAGKVRATMTVTSGYAALYVHAGATATTSTYTCATGLDMAVNSCVISVSGATTVYAHVNVLAAATFKVKMTFDSSSLCSSLKECQYDSTCVTDCDHCELFTSATVPAENACNDVQLQPKWTRVCQAETACNPSSIIVRGVWSSVEPFAIRGNLLYGFHCDEVTPATDPIDTYVLDLSAATPAWAPVCVGAGCTNRLTMRGDAAIMVVGNRLYIGGGNIDFADPNTYYQDHRYLNLDTPTGWTNLNPTNQPPKHRASASVAWNGNWVILPRITETNGRDNTIYLYDGTQWSTFTPTNVLVFGYGAASIIGDIVYVTGASFRTTTSTLLAYPGTLAPLVYTLDLSAATKTWNLLCPSFDCAGDSTFAPSNGYVGAIATINNILYYTARLLRDGTTMEFDTWVIDTSAATPRWVRLCRAGDANCQAVNGVYPGIGTVNGYGRAAHNYNGKLILTTYLGPDYYAETYSLGCESSKFCPTTLSCVASCGTCQGYPLSTTHNHCQACSGGNVLCPKSNSCVSNCNGCVGYSSGTPKCVCSGKFCPTDNSCMSSCAECIGYPNGAGSVCSVCSGANPTLCEVTNTCGTGCTECEGNHDFQCSACKECSVAGEVYCKQSNTCVATCGSCGLSYYEDSAADVCRVPQILSLCPGVGSYVPDGSAVDITVELDIPITKVDAGTYTLSEKCSSGWSVVETNSISTVVASGNKVTLSPAKVLQPGCDYKVDWGSNINIDFDIVSPSFEYIFTTRATVATNTVLNVGFILGADPADYSNAPLLQLFDKFNCDISPKLVTAADVGSVAVHVSFSNLETGTAQHLVDYLVYLLGSTEFSIQLQARHLGTVVVGSISSATASNLLTAVTVTNSPSNVGALSTITISFTTPSGISNAADKIRILFPEGFALSGTQFLKINGGSSITGTAVGATTMVEWVVGTTVAAGQTVTLEITGVELPEVCTGLNGWVWGVQIRDSTASFAVEDYYLGNPPGDTCHDRTVVVFGDPHFKSFSGGYFDINGIAGHIYNIITDEHFVWNSMFVADDVSMAKHSVRTMQTFLGKTSFVALDGVVEMDPHDFDVFLNGVITEKGARVRLQNATNYYIKSEPGLAFIRVPGFRIALKRVVKPIVHVRRPSFNYHFDHAVDLIAEETVQPHGLLGQTARFKSPVVPVDHKGSGIIEGILHEYKVNYLTQVNYKYNRYDIGGSDGLQRKMSHWAYTWFNMLPIAEGTVKADGFEVIVPKHTTGNLERKSSLDFWVTNMKAFKLNTDDSKSNWMQVMYLRNPSFAIELTIQRKSVLAVHVKASDGNWVKVHADPKLDVNYSSAYQPKADAFATKTLLIKKAFIGKLGNTTAGLWVEEFPMSTNGYIITLEKHMTLYLRRENPEKPFFGLQVEVHNSASVKKDASGIFIDALTKRVVTCCEQYYPAP